MWRRSAKKNPITIVDPTADIFLPAKLAAANAASDARDWHRTLVLWEALREQHPGEALCWRKAGEAYYHAGQAKRAEAILKEATNQFQDDFWISYDYVLVAQRMGNWSKALQRAETLRNRFPDISISHVLIGEAFRNLRRLDEAEVAFAGAVERFPGDEWPLYHYAELAEFRRDWETALRRWETLLAASPDHRGARSGRARALRGLGRLDVAPAAEAIIDDVDIPVEATSAWRRLLVRRRGSKKDPAITAGPVTDVFLPAKLAAASAASDAGDWHRGMVLWDTLREQHPGEALYWQKAGEAYYRSGQGKRAEVILEEAMRRFSDDFLIAYNHVLVAQRMGNWSKALQRAETLRDRFPDNAISHAVIGEAYRGLGQLDAAEVAFGKAVERFPGEEWNLIHYAELAEFRQDWDAALWRWEKLLAASPDHRNARVGRAQALHRLGRLDVAAAADAVADEARRQRGGAAGLPARVAEADVLIEITSVCNFACTYCVSPMKLREKKEMSLETFRQVIEQVATFTTRPIRLAVDGEPTGHPRFREMALLANEYGLPIWVATNGSRLDPGFLDIWMDPLISMSTLPEELAKRHNKLDFDSYIARIVDYTAAWSRSSARQNLNFQIIHYPQLDATAEAEYRRRKDAFLVEFCQRAGLYETCSEQNSVEDEDYHFQRKAHPGVLHFLKQRVTAGGLYPVDGKMVGRERATAGFCNAPWRQLVIHSNGTIGACCTDLSGGTTFASAEEAATIPIKQLWESSPRITAMRDAFLQGRVELDVCQRCLSQGQVRYL